MKQLLIVGASSGIGQQLALRLDGTDWNVRTISRRTDTGAPWPHKSWDAADSKATFPLDHLPESLDGLVYCPGSIRLLPFERLDDAAFRDDLEVNLMGAVRAIRGALPALKAASQSSVVLFSTVAVGTGMPMHAAIAAAKGAVEGLTRSLAAEFAPRIRVNAIAPSLSDTPLAGKLLKTDRLRESAAARHPLERFGTADDIAGAAQFLLDESSSWMTGQVVHVDGGIGTLRRFG